MKFQKKPVIVDAYQTKKDLDIKTLEGIMHAAPGDWIITGVMVSNILASPIFSRRLISYWKNDFSFLIHLTKHYSFSTLNFRTK